MPSPILRRQLLKGLVAGTVLGQLPRIALAGLPADDSRRLRELIAASDAAVSALESLPRSRPPPGAPAFVDPLSEATLQAALGNAQRNLSGLASLNRANLLPVERIAADVLEYDASRQIERHRAGLDEVLRRVPLDPSSGLHVELPDYISGAGAPFENAADYELGLARLHGFAAYLESTIACLTTGLAQGYRQPRVVAAKVLEQLRAMLALPIDETPFVAATKQFPDALDTVDRRRFTAQYRRTVETVVLPGYRRLAAYLESHYLPRALDTPGRCAMKDGLRLYQDELLSHTTVTVAADELHATGLAQVQAYRDRMEDTRARTGFKGELPAFFEFIRNDPRFYYTKPDELLARFREIEQQIWSGIPRLFSRKPQAPFEVRPLPALGGQRGTGYYRAGPPDGRTPGVLWFNMAMLGTRPIPTLETLTLHEGIPGHHFQITLAREDATLPDNLRFGSLTAYAEGWGLYAESLGPELGMFTDPYQLFGHLDMGMLRAVRLVVDTGLHANGWSRPQAIDYMRSNTSMAPHDIEVEIDRYISWPGQACAYKTGELRIRALRDEAARKLGPSFDVRAFHGWVLDTGALPLTVLERKVRDACCAG